MAVKLDLSNVLGAINVDIYRVVGANPDSEHHQILSEFFKHHNNMMMGINSDLKEMDDQEGVSIEQTNNFILSIFENIAEYCGESVPDEYYEEDIDDDLAEEVAVSPKQNVVKKEKDKSDNIQVLIERFDRLNANVEKIIALLEAKVI